MPLPQPTLQSDRLLLRPFTLADAPAVQRLAGAREIADTTAHIPHPYPEGAAEQWITGHALAWDAGTLATYAITERSRHELLGAIGLTILPEHERAELGYWIGLPSWGHGYCTEAGRALLTLGFETLRLHRIQARHFTRNPASGRVMQKLGMRLEGVQRDGIKKWDRFEDVAFYSILETEWRFSAAAAPRDAKPGLAG